MRQAWLIVLIPWLALADSKETALVFKDIAYLGSTSEPAQKLDIYLPVKVSTDTPVLVMVHGGAWISGTKTAYEPLARNFAQEGVVAVVVEYRLSPKVKHPAHADDVREALKWVAAQAGKYGFNPKRIFLMGHSAGAHMAAFLAVEPKDLPAGIPAGYIGLAGIYDLEKLDKRWPGYDKWFLNDAFGPRGAKWKDASPRQSPFKSKAPWLLIHGEPDELAEVDQTKVFHAHLVEQNLKAELIIDKTMDHFGVLRDLGSARNSLTPKILAFIR